MAVQQQDHGDKSRRTSSDQSFAGRDRTLVYADPPYFEKAGTLYMNSFGDAEHVALATLLSERADASWLLTYDNVPRVAVLYSGFRRQIIELNYSAHRVTRASEVMVFSDDLTMSAAKS
jgi:DNA adenine methylase